MLYTTYFMYRFTMCYVKGFKYWLIVIFAPVAADDIMITWVTTSTDIPLKDGAEDTLDRL